MVSGTLEEDGSPPAEAARYPANEGESPAGEEALREMEKGEEEEEGKKVEEEKHKRKRMEAVEKGEDEGMEKERKRRSMAREPTTPVERPLRERKAVERYTALSPRRTSATKVLSIEQVMGSDTVADFLLAGLLVMSLLNL